MMSGFEKFDRAALPWQFVFFQELQLALPITNNTKEVGNFLFTS